MGLAASQARLLSITSRISDNELRAQLINNQKMRLSSESSQVSENYINALNKTNLVFANYDKDDKAQNVPLTFNNLTAFNQYNNQYGLTNAAGNILISETEAKKYQASIGADDPQAEFLKQHGIEYTTSYWDEISKQIAVDSDGDGQPDSGINFTATELKQMYEGVQDKNNPANSIPSYDETIKTQAYNDFAAYADEFANIQGTLSRAETQKNAMLTTYAQKAMATTSIPTASLNGTTLTNLSAIQGVIDTLMTSNFTGVKAGDFKLEQSDITDWFTSQEVSYTGGQYVENISKDDLGISGTPTTTVATNATAARNALYYRDTAGNTYMRIDKGEDATGEYSRWIKIPSSGSGGCDTKIYKLSGNNMVQDTDKDGNGYSVNSASLSQNNGKYELSLSLVDDGTTYTETRQYGAPGSGAATTQNIIPPSTMAQYVTEYIQTFVSDLFVQCGKEHEVNQSSPNFTALSKEEQDILTKASVNNATDIQTVIDGLKGCIFKDPAAVNYSATELLAILNELTSGAGWKTGTVKLHDGKKEFNFNWGDVKPEIKPVINAYVIDTMMDVFGEPVYGYLYTNGAGKVQPKSGNVDASAEAKWFINLFDKIQSSGYQILANGLANSTDWLQFALENGIVVMEQVNSDNNWQGITYTSCSDISEQTDSTAATIAEAEYNKAMRQIEAKDEMFDLELKNIDTEHSSLQAEYESVKKAMSGNIERNFQMYS